MKKNIIGFTFIELIVAITIIVILTGIGFISYSTHISDARDSQRKSDLLQVSSALKVYKQKRGYHGFPGDYFNITYSGITVSLQGKLNENVHIDSLEKLPYDPKTKEYYSYSITNNKQEFQLGGTLENQNDYIAILEGTYKSVSKNILPTILLATGATYGSNVEVQSGTTLGDSNRMLFIYNKQNHNLPYVFEDPYEPYSDGISFTGLLDEVVLNKNFWQNSDYRNCTEIYEAGKTIIPFSATSFEYQIISETGTLVNTGCTL